MQRFLIVLSTCFFSAICILQAGDVVLDDFSYTANPSGSPTFHSGSMEGGEMDLILFSGVSPSDIAISGGSFRITSTQSGTGARLVYDGVDVSSNSNYGLNLDMTGGGTNDRLRINIASITGAIDVFIAIYEGEDDGYTMQRTISSVGAHDLLFEDFSLLYESDGVDPTGIKEVSVSFYGFLDSEAVVVDSMVFTGNVTPPNPGNSNAAAKAVLTKKLKKTKKSLKRAKQRRQKAKLKKLKKQLRKLKVRLRML